MKKGEKSLSGSQGLGGTHNINPPVVSLRERVKMPPADAMVRACYGPSIEKGLQYCFEAEMLVHLAHGQMLARQGIVESDEMRNILSAVLELYSSGADSLEIDYTLEDMYSYVERYLIKKLGPEVGGRLHTARSRNDLHTTTWRIVLREKLITVMNSLVSLRNTVSNLAAEHAVTVMPGYTHSQHAQPITLGYYMLTVSDLLARDYNRLKAALAQSDRCPLGSGALTTTGFPIDREGTAAALGFQELVEVAYDGVSCRDDVHESAASLAILMTNLSRLAFDLQNWNTMEYGFIELSDSYSAVSSIMPQKKNPHPLEHIKSAAAHVTGSLTTVLACTKNTSLSDVNDGVSAINAPVLEASERTSVMLDLINGVLGTLTVHPEVMLRSSAIGFGTATELADVIVRETGLSFRIAHNIVGRVVVKTLEAGKNATDITVDDLEESSQELFGKSLDIKPQVIHEALDPTLNVQVRTVIGGTNPENVRNMVSERKKQLNIDIKELTQAKQHIEQAAEKLKLDVEHFVNS
jgi:argininosuccinate lyase